MAGKLLTAEQERALICQAQRGDEHARSVIIEYNTGLIWQQVHRYINLNVSGLDMNDLFQEGAIGLLRAVDKFDLSKPYRFSTYATWWVRQAVGRAIDEQSHLIHRPVHVAEKLRRGMFTTSPYPTLQSPASLDESPSEESDTPRGNLIAASDNTEDTAIANYDRTALYHALSHLNERQRRVIALRYGLDEGDWRSLKEVGTMLGLTSYHVRQVEKDALATLRSLLGT